MSIDRRALAEQRSAEFCAFDNMIESEHDFVIAIVTMPDDYILRLHDYLVRKEAVASEEAVDRLRNMVSRLEEIPVVQEHMNSIILERDKEISEIVQKLADRKAKKAGFVKKFINNINKNKRK